MWSTISLLDHSFGMKHISECFGVVQTGTHSGLLQNFLDAHTTKNIVWGEGLGSTGFDCLLLLQTPIGSLGDAREATYCNELIEFHSFSSLIACIESIFSSESGSNGSRARMVTCYMPVLACVMMAPDL